MAVWTFMTLLGNERRVSVDQVRASSFWDALKAWYAVVKIDGRIPVNQEKLLRYETTADGAGEYAFRHSPGVWSFLCYFEMRDIWDDLDSTADVWVIKTDASGRTQGELFDPG